MIRGTDNRFASVRFVHASVSAHSFLSHEDIHRVRRYSTLSRSHIIPIPFFPSHASHFREVSWYDYDSYLDAGTFGRKHRGTFKLVADNYSVVHTFLQKTFKRRRSVSASDIADALGMDYADTREILARMIKEGKLGLK